MLTSQHTSKATPIVEGKEKYRAEKEGEACESKFGDENKELIDVPMELSDLREKDFNTDRALPKELDDRGFGDFRVVFLKDGTPRLFSPSDQRNSLTTHYVAHYNAFVDRRGELGLCSGTHKVHLSNGKSRDPDISYWGSPLCREDPEDGIACLIDGGALPDVVVKFSWDTSFDYDKLAIEDMLSKGLEYEGGPLSVDRPRLGYLIKVRFYDKRTIAGKDTKDVIGLDIFRLPHGTTLDQALDEDDPSAEYSYYEPGAAELLISIGREDLGIPPADLLVEGSSDEYAIKASNIYARVREYHEQCQMNGLAT
jgi:hypothetical protein